MNFTPYKHNLHYNRCMEIFDSNVPQYFTKTERIEFAQWLQQKVEPYWVMQHNNVIVGCGGIYFAEKHTKSSAEFTNEVGFAWGMVHHNYHKKGLGKQLTQFRIDY